MGRYNLKKAKETFLSLLAFSTPKAIVFDLSLILLILALLPTSKLYYLPVRSVYENVLGITPYSSGMTRALSSLMHFDPFGAWRYNKLSYLVFLVIVIMIVVNLYRLVREKI